MEYKADVSANFTILMRSQNGNQAAAPLNEQDVIILSSDNEENEKEKEENVTLNVPTMEQQEPSNNNNDWFDGLDFNLR